LQALAHADDGLQAGVQGGQGPLVHGLVGLGEVLAALGVAHDDVLHAQVHQHVGADLAGVGAGLFKVDVLGAHVDVGALGLGHGGDQVGVRGADDHLAAGVLDGGDQLVDQGGGLGGVLVHLPVAGNDGLALFFIHLTFSLSFFQNKRVRRRVAAAPVAGLCDVCSVRVLGDRAAGQL